MGTRSISYLHSRVGNSGRPARVSRPHATHETQLKLTVQTCRNSGWKRFEEFVAAHWVEEFVTLIDQENGFLMLKA